MEPEAEVHNIDLPYQQFDGKYVLGIEGSANKIGIG